MRDGGVGGIDDDHAALRDGRMRPAGCVHHAIETCLVHRLSRRDSARRWPRAAGAVHGAGDLVVDHLPQLWGEVALPPRLHRGQQRCRDRDVPGVFLEAAGNRRALGAVDGVRPCDARSAAPLSAGGHLACSPDAAGAPVPRAEVVADRPHHRLSRRTRPRPGGPARGRPRRPRPGSGSVPTVRPDQRGPVHRFRVGLHLFPQPAFLRSLESASGSGTARGVGL